MATTRKPEEFDRWTVVALVRSHSDPDKEYPVSKKGKGEWKCECKGNRLGHRFCTHLRESVTVAKRVLEGNHDLGTNVQMLHAEAF